jgi:hypothetical protein
MDITLQDNSGEDMGITPFLRIDPAEHIDFDQMGKWLATQTSERQARFVLGFMAGIKPYPAQIEFLVEDLEGATSDDGGQEFEAFLEYIANSWRNR